MHDKCVHTLRDQQCKNVLFFFINLIHHFSSFVPSQFLLAVRCSYRHNDITTRVNDDVENV